MQYPEVTYLQCQEKKIKKMGTFEKCRSDGKRIGNLN